MKNIFTFKKIFVFGFFAALAAVFLYSGSVQAGFFDWMNGGKNNEAATVNAAADLTTAPTPPSAPSSLAATAGECGSGTVGLSWTDNSGGSAHFVVVRAGGALSGKNSASYQVKKGSSSYTVSGVAGSVWHKFYIAACSDGYCSDLVGSNAVNPAANCSSANYSITVGKTGNGSGTLIGKNGDSEIINCGNDCFESNIVYDNSGKIILTATPDSGSVFSKWQGDAECNNVKTNVCSVSKNKNHKLITAVFNKITQSGGGAKTVTLNISKNGNGSGTVIMDDKSEEVTCDLSSTCSYSFKAGKNVFLLITPNSDSKVVSISGGVANSGNSKNKECTVESNKSNDTKQDCYIKMTGNKTITVNFASK
ncbi:hypothetical protein C4572_03375 [Candidatus Parcubacteria bacterium]|nr:MAG: hypothetical protein C4572_03375 [Candidatus Parcubacteria bacterium]